MIAVHMTSVYTLPEPQNRSVLERQCDRLMDVLVQMEQDDSSVRDAAVSSDLAAGRVEVEVLAFGADFEDAAHRANTRVAEAIARMLSTSSPAERHMELVAA